MWTRLLCPSLISGLAALAAAMPAAGEDPVPVKKVKVLVYAKPAGKLSAGLQALKLSGGTLVGWAGDGAVVEVPAASFAAAEAALTKAGAAKVTAKVPDAVEKPLRLIATCRKGAKLSEQTLKKHHFRIADRHDQEDGSLILLENTAPLTSEAITALEKDPAATHLEADRTVSLPPQPQGKPRRE